MSRGSHARCAAALALIIVFAGCTAPAPGASGGAYPAPGEMRVAAVEPLEQKNLFWEGSFEEWYAGAPGPSGRLTPPGTNSRIERAPQPAGIGRWVMRQVWQVADSKWDAKGRFAMQFDNLEPQSTYTVSLDAAVPEGKAVDIELFGFAEDGSAVPIALPLVRVEPGAAMKRYTAAFDTGLLRVAELQTACFVLPENGEQALVLDNVELGFAGAAAPAAPPRGEGNLAVNGSFERWAPGKPLPDGPFTAPSAALKHSTAERWLRSAAGGKIALYQVWSANDHADPPGERFGFEVDGLAPNTRYALGFAIDRVKNFPAAVSVYGVAENGETPCIACPLYTAEGEEKWWQEKSAAFDSGVFTKVRIETHLPADAGLFPVRVLWDDWSLRPAGGAAEAQKKQAQ